MLQRERHLIAYSSVRSTSFRTVTLCLCGFAAGIFLVDIVRVAMGSRTITCALQRYRQPTQALSGLNDLPAASEEKFLLVGIMTARKYLATRAVASNLTWVSRVPGKVVYFLEKGEAYHGDLNVVELDGVEENDYPPQKKSFAMLQYINQHYAGDFEWIIRADDDLFIQVEELVKFLKSVDNRKLVYIGRPGHGSRTEQGKLGLTGAYCMGGPGVVMSNTLLKALSPYLTECLNSTVTLHEDTELGRCIHSHLKVNCTLSFDIEKKFYHNYNRPWENFGSFHGEWDRREERALTLHAFKEPAFVFSVANFFTNRTLQNLKAKEARLITEMLAMHYQRNKTVKMLPDMRHILRPRQWAHITQLMSAVNKSNTNGSSFFGKGRNIYDLYSIWDIVNKKSLYSIFLGEYKLIVYANVKGRGIMHFNNLKQLEASPWFAKAKGMSGHSQILDVTYQHLSTDQGTRELIFVQNVNGNNNTIVPVLVRRRFLPHLVEFRETQEENVTQNGTNTIYILLTVFQKSSCYTRYLQNHKRAVDGYGGKVDLRVVLFTDEAGEHINVSEATSAMLKDNPHLHIQTILVNETFGRAKGLILAMESLANSSLLLLMDVDMEYNSDFLYRVSRNTAMGRSVYYPVVFSQFSPEVSCYKRADCEEFMRSQHDDVGLWRSFGYGVVSVVKQDLLRAGSFRTDIKGWGLEDVDLHQKIITKVGAVMRAADNGIIHRYHKHPCNRSLPKIQMASCENSKKEVYGSLRQLFRIYEDMADTNNAAKNPIR